MESHYGIGINNRYALFLDEEGEEGEQGFNLIKPRPGPLKKEAEKKPVVSVTTAIKPIKDLPKPTNNREDKENRGNDRFSGKRVLDARKAQEGPREDRNNRRNHPEGGEKLSERTENARGGGRGGRGRGGLNGSDRGGKGSRGGMSRPKREFERKSGDDKTGIKHVDKREGGGSHNWGTFEDDIKAEDDKVNTSTDDAKDTEKETTKNESPGEVIEETEEPEDVDPITMTLDEWKAQQSQKNAPKWNTRKAGEGSEIDPKWKKTYAYKKEKEAHEDEEEDEEAELYPQRVNRQKRVLDIEFSFTDNAPQRGGREGGRGGRGVRGGRGTRGAPRGTSERRERGDRIPGDERRERRGGVTPRGDGVRRGGGRGGLTTAPNVNDEASFPTLGNHK